MKLFPRSYPLTCAAALIAAQLTGAAFAQTQPTTAPTTMPATGPGTGNGNAVPGSALPGNALPQRALTGVKQQNGGMTLNFQDASIDVILDELSSAAGFIVVKEVRPEGRVSLVSKQPVSPTEAIALLNTVLRGAKLAAIQQDRVLKIVSADSAKRLNIPVHSGNDPTKIANNDELITQIIPIRYANATELKNDLSPLVNPSADFAANASSNALVITDTSANIKRVVEIVSALDTSVADSVEVKVFQLKFANASSAAKLINDVFGNVESARGASGASSGGGGGAHGGRGGGGGGFGGGGPGGGFERFMAAARGGNSNNSQKGKVSASSDDRTNSVVVSGPGDMLTSIGNVIKELDSNPAAEQSVYVYRLRNAQASNLESVLNNLFNGTGTSSSRSSNTTSNADTLRQYRSSSGSSYGSSGSRTGSSSGRSSGSSSGGRGTGGNTGGGGSGGFGGFGGFGGATGGGNNRASAASSQTASDLAGQVSIIADTDTNSLVIRTAPANYQRVKEVVADLDRPVQQVLIKVLLAEVTHDNGSDIGAELSALNLRTRTDAAGNTITLGQTGGTGFNIPVTGANATGMVVQLLENNFQATIRALETNGKLDVLSRPYILASDNQLASITVGEEVPLIDSSRITDTGQTINTLRYEDVGILLDVIPHINPDGLVILDVAPEISQLTSRTVPISDTASAPVIAKRSAQSRVGVRSGQTVVIGGLMEDRITESVDKVPLLGDIPFIGEAFKRTVKSKTKTELLIFLTPHVAEDPDLLPGMSKDEIDSTKLLPKAVAPGVWEEHRKGLESGEPPPTSRPTENPLNP